jgi:hypothetical protein
MTENAGLEVPTILCVLSGRYPSKLPVANVAETPNVHFVFMNQGL